MKRQNIRLYKQYLPIKGHQGYVLLITLLFTTIMIAAGIHFFTRTVEHTKNSGSMRDSTQASLLVESAMNLAMGQYVSSENRALRGIHAAKEGQATLLAFINDIPNMYYITDTDNAVVEINQASPNILQLVANGESRKINFNPTNSQRLTTSAGSPLTGLRVNDLFDPANAFKPTLYTLNAGTGLLQVSANTWDAESAVDKAAVWFELVQNSFDANTIDVYVEAVVEVDGAMSYLQRRVWSYSPIAGNTTMENLGCALLCESSTGDNRREVDKY